MGDIDGVYPGKYRPPHRGEHRPGQACQKAVAPVGKDHVNGGKKENLHHQQKRAPQVNHVHQEDNHQVVDAVEQVHQGVTENMQYQRQHQHQQKQQRVHHADAPGIHIAPVLLHAVNRVQAV